MRIIVTEKQLYIALLKKVILVSPRSVTFDRQKTLPWKKGPRMELHQDTPKYTNIQMYNNYQI